MTYSRNRYDREFKKKDVRLSFKSPKPVKTIASKLGVPERALYRWRKLYTKDGEQTPFASLEAEIRALKRCCSGFANQYHFFTHIYQIMA